MTVDLTLRPAQVATIEPLRFGGWLKSALGGAHQRLDRFGDRWAITYTFPPCRIEAEGRRLIADLFEGLDEGVSLAIPQVDFDVGAPGSPTVNGALSGGTSLSVKGGTPRYPYKKGQFVSVRNTAGRSCAHMIMAQSIADASGNAVLTVKPAIHAVFADGDEVNVAKPVIEGPVVDDSWSWTLEMTRTVGLTIRVEETA